MIRELAGTEPISPEGDGGCQLADGLVLGGRAASLPRERHEAGLPRLQGGPPVAACAHRAEHDRTRQGQWGTEGGACAHRLIFGLVVLPRHHGGPVVEQGYAIRDHLDSSPDAGCEADQVADRRCVAGSSPILRASSSLAHRSHRKEILYQEPPVGGVPRRLHDHRSREVPSLVRNVRVRWPESEASSGAVEQRAEDAGRVGPR